MQRSERKWLWFLHNYRDLDWGRKSLDFYKGGSGLLFQYRDFEMKWNLNHFLIQSIVANSNTNTQKQKYNLNQFLPAKEPADRVNKQNFPKNTLSKSAEIKYYFWFLLSQSSLVKSLTCGKQGYQRQCRYFSKLQYSFLWIAMYICLNCTMYLSNCKIHLSKLQNVFVQIAIFICVNCKNICLSKVYLSKLQIVFV